AVDMRGCAWLLLLTIAMLGAVPAPAHAAPVLCVSDDPAPGSCPEYGSAVALNVWASPHPPYPSGDYFGGNVSACVQPDEGPTPACSDDLPRSNASVSWDVGQRWAGPLDEWYVDVSDHACNAAPLPTGLQMPVGGLPNG